MEGRTHAFAEDPCSSHSPYYFQHCPVIYTLVFFFFSKVCTVSSVPGVMVSTRDIKEVKKVSLF